MRSIPSFKERRLEWPVRALNPVITFASETTIAITVPSLGNVTSSLTNIRLKPASLSLHSSQRFCYEVSNLKCPSCSEPLYYSNNRFECVNWESNWTLRPMESVTRISLFSFVLTYFVAFVPNHAFFERMVNVERIKDWRMANYWYVD